MRPFLFLFLLFFFCSAARAQRIAGSVVDRQGRSIEYVNVGVEGTQTGVVSDGQGRFALTIPDSLAGGTLYVSHITYEPKRIPLREALRQAADAEPLTIELAERAFAIPEIAVRPGAAGVNARKFVFRKKNANIAERGIGFVPVIKRLTYHLKNSFCVKVP